MRRTSLARSGKLATPDADFYELLGLVLDTPSAAFSEQRWTLTHPRAASFLATPMPLPVISNPLSR